MWSSYIEGYAYPENFGKWFDDFLEVSGLRLVGFGSDLDPRRVKGLEKNDKSRVEDCVIYEDYSPFMLISENSLNELNSRLEKKVSMRNFRPNFVATGCEAFAEVIIFMHIITGHVFDKKKLQILSKDNWTKFQIGEANMFKIKHCTRWV